MRTTIRRMLTGLLGLTLLVASCSSLPTDSVDQPGSDTLPGSAVGSPPPTDNSEGASVHDPEILYPRTGVSWRWTNEDIYADYLSQLAGASTWIEVEWCIAEPQPGTFNWNPLDRNIERSQRFGIETQLRLRVGSCWATGGIVGEARGALRSTPSSIIFVWV